MTALPTLEEGTTPRVHEDLNPTVAEGRSSCLDKAGRGQRWHQT